MVSGYRRFTVCTVDKNSNRTHNNINPTEMINILLDIYVIINRNRDGVTLLVVQQIVC